MKVLQMISSAYRATFEEQDDTVLWLTQAMKNAGGEFDVLLTGNAVNYAVRGQDASGLSFGGWKQTQPPRIEDDLARMTTKGIAVYALADDLVERGLSDVTLVPGVRRIQRGDIARLMNGYDQVWRW
jgi:sulfur transfer complex TusBCD TusB component (DsrH family)